METVTLSRAVFDEVCKEIKCHRNQLMNDNRSARTPKLKEHYHAHATRLQELLKALAEADK